MAFPIEILTIKSKVLHWEFRETGRRWHLLALPTTLARLALRAQASRKEKRLTQLPRPARPYVGRTENGILGTTSGRHISPGWPERGWNGEHLIVMLSAVKHLAAYRVRSFALLRMTRVRSG